MQDLIEETINIVDQIIETEGAFGMRFGGVDFEARFKGNNSRSYPRQKIEDLETCTRILHDISLYLESNRIHGKYGSKFSSTEIDNLIEEYHNRIPSSNPYDGDAELDLDIWITQKINKL